MLQICRPFSKMSLHMKLTIRYISWVYILTFTDLLRTFVEDFQKSQYFRNVVLPMYLYNIDIQIDK